MVVVEGGSTKFNVKHQGKDIHHPPSTIYKWPLSDLPEATLSPSLSLSITINFWGVWGYGDPTCIPYRPLKHSLDSLSLSIVVEECKDLIWELRRRFLILVPEEAGIWCKTKFSVKHQGKDIHNLQSTIYKWPLGDKPLPYLSLTLSLSFTINFRGGGGMVTPPAHPTCHRNCL